jgi:hypothetical protein
MCVTGQYHKGDTKSTPNCIPLTGEGSNAMKHQASRWLRVLLGLLLFAAGGGQPGGFDLVAQQIEIMGTRQWLGLMAGAAIAPVSQCIAGTLPHRLTPFAWDELPSVGTAARDRDRVTPIELA